MESIISHLIIDPTWVKMTAIVSIILSGIIAIFTVIEADNDEKQNNQSFNIVIKYTILCSGIIIFMFIPFALISQKPNAYQKIINNKEYTLTKNNKILKISSASEFLPSTDLEIIYEDDKTIQVKLDDKLYTIDKASEKINEN